MYTVDQHDRVAEHFDVPQCSIGAPLPIVIADEHHVGLTYLIELREPGQDGRSVRLVTAASLHESIAVVNFGRPRAHVFGPPNDEALTGHPLSSRGLHPYAAFEVFDSSWIRQLARGIVFRSRRVIGGSSFLYESNRWIVLLYDE
jgi:hypothetical protein